MIKKEVIIIRKGLIETKSRKSSDRAINMTRNTFHEFTTEVFITLKRNPGFMFKEISFRMYLVNRGF